MNELTQSSRQLPDTLPELSKFVLIGRERLEAVKASIRAIDKVGLAKEVHEQKLAEAQELAEAVTDAEVRMGQLLKAVPKAGNGKLDSKRVEIPKSKTKLCDAVQAGGVNCVVFVAEHSTPYPQTIIAKDATVKRIYWNGRWYSEPKQRKLYEIALNFISFIKESA